MITITGQPGRDFTLLNLSDPQMTGGEWAPEHRYSKILHRTVSELVERVHPDLITVSGDISYAGDMDAYRNMRDYLDSFGIPWTCCFGNHDNQGGPEQVSAVVEMYRQSPLFLYEPCDPALGDANFVIVVEQDGKPIHGILMMDTHDRMLYIAPDGEKHSEWSTLIPAQLDWYRDRIGELNAMGCPATTVISHIPIYAYRDAFAAAIRPDVDPNTVKPGQDTGAAIWNPGYEDSFGVKYEAIFSYPADEGAFTLMRDLGSTKNILCGHDHVTNFVVRYQGVRFIYSLKAGAGCYWRSELCGGTVLTYAGDGSSAVHHEYVDVSDLL